MSLYLETSCLLKLVLDEPDSPAVEAALSGETEILVSVLGQLEAKTVLQAMHRGGDLNRRELTTADRALDELLHTPPFRLVPVPADSFAHALHHVEAAAAYCRTLDRLHLGVAESLGLKRLMTADRTQAAAARAAGFAVMEP
jgi:uncharacterized protein with PIN domain